MFGIYLPHAVYETLPYAYLLFGVMSVLSFTLLLPKLCGGLLLWVGVSVLRMRTQYRRHHYAHPLHRPHAH